MGGGGGTFSGRDPYDIARQVRQEESQTDTAAFEAELAAEFNKLLAAYNDRNAGLIADRLAQVKEAIGRDIEGTIDTLFGGSVSKHTYVDGLSDVDSLLIMSGTDMADLRPQAILRHMAAALGERLSGKATVEPGRIAITVTYQDGMRLQFLPALKSADGLRVPAWEGNQWSAINPEQFKQGLTKRNEDCGGKVVPTIKLAKAINASLPEGVQLSGYHIESLAVAAFRGYEGDKTTVRMLPHFFERAKDLVLKPMTDRTGQSVHVDEYLGGEGSEQRRQVNHVLDRIARRMKNAHAARSKDQWLDLFGD